MVETSGCGKMHLVPALEGRIPLVSSYTERSDALYTVLKTVAQESRVLDSMRLPTCSAFSTKITMLDSSEFFRSNLEPQWNQGVDRAYSENLIGFLITLRA